MLMLLFLSLFNSACEEGPVPEPKPLIKFDEVVSSGGSIVNPATFQNVDTVASANEQQIIEDDIWICKDIKVDLSQNAEDFVLYASNNAEIIYPGNFLQGKSVFEGAPRIIPLKRGPGTITINTLNGSSVVTETVDEVSFSKIAQATNDLIGNNNGNLTANITYERNEVRSLQEVGVHMNAEYEGLGAKVKGSFDFEGSYSYNSIFVKVTQSLYSIVLDIPDVEEAFDPSVTPEDLAKHIGDGNPATYISSVNYGRIFYLLIQSTQSSTDIKAALSGSFDGVVGSGSGSVDVSVVNDLENVRVSGYAYGGDANLAAGALIGDMEDVKTFIEAGGAINNGAPISYVVRSLEDPSIVVAANLATQYTITECENVSGGVIDFTDSRQAVGAATYNGGSSRHKMVLFDKTNSEYVDYNIETGILSQPKALWQWSHDNTHPFRNTGGIGAAAHIRSNSVSSTTFFNHDGTKYSNWRHDNAAFGVVHNLWEWGTDNSCPFTAVGAAMDISLGSREIFCMFNKAGTEYTFYESGVFSTPRLISDMQVKDRNDPVAIPFTSVGAAMRMSIRGVGGDESDRVVMAIFDGEGKKYVYFDVDRNVIVGPLDI